MVSFDVEALYINVPIEDTLVIIKEHLENDETLSDRTPLSPKNVLDLLEFLVCTTFFIFNGTYYQQTEGVVMGGPPSSIVAEIYMQATETTALTTTSHPPKVWERDVDDVFSMYKIPTYLTSSNISTVSTPRQSLPWKLNRIPKSHSWIYSSREIVTTPSLSESTGNLHTQTNTLNSHLTI